MKVVTLRLPDPTINKLKSISDKTDMDMTSTLRMLLKVAFDVVEKTPIIPPGKIPEIIRSPELMFLREVHRVTKDKK